MIVRCHDWQSKLSRFLIDNRSRAFAFGSWDCCLFVADAIESMTGTDLAAPFRGRYASFRSALKVARHQGERSILGLIGAVAKSHGMAEVSPAFAARGDMAFVTQSNGGCLGILDLSGTGVVIPTDGGLWKASLALAAVAWRV